MCTGLVSSRLVLSRLVLCETLVACFVFLCYVVSCVWRCLPLFWRAVSVVCIVLVSWLVFRVCSGGRSRGAAVCCCVFLCVSVCWERSGGGWGVGVEEKGEEGGLYASNASLCVRSKRPRVLRHHAPHVVTTCGLGAGTHGDVLRVTRTRTRNTHTDTHTHTENHAHAGPKQDKKQQVFGCIGKCHLHKVTFSKCPSPVDPRGRARPLLHGHPVCGRIFYS